MRWEKTHKKYFQKIFNEINYLNKKQCYEKENFGVQKKSHRTKVYRYNIFYQYLK